MKKDYAWPVTAISKEDYNAVVNCAREHKELFSGKTILIFGAGIRGAVFSTILEDIGHTNIVFTDNNSEKWGGYVDKYPIVSVAEALRMRESAVYVISVEEGNGIRLQLIQEGLREDQDFFFPKSGLYDHFMQEFKRENRNKTLIVGDCMFEVISFDDKNKASLAEIIQEKLGYQNVKQLTMHGMSLPSFYHVFKAQLNRGMKPEIFVIMLNFETLTGKQHLLPRSQHTELIREICECSPDPDGELAAYLQTVNQRVKNVQAEFFTTSRFSARNKENNNRGTISDSASKVFLKMNYMYCLDPTIESIRYLTKIMRMAREIDCVVLPFVPPVNYERGTELFGEKFEKAYDSNLRTLESVIAAENFQLLDLSHICPKEEFAHVSTPDETTNYVGRTKVAERLCGEIKRIEVQRNGK